MKKKETKKKRERAKEQGWSYRGGVVTVERIKEGGAEDEDIIRGECKREKEGGREKEKERDAVTVGVEIRVSVGGEYTRVCEKPSKETSYHRH